jgi:hypothetical protein
MSEDGHDLVERLHREAAERHWEKERRDYDLIVAIHAEAVQELWEQRQKTDEAIARLHREAAERASEYTAPMEEPATVHYTELPEAKPGSPLYREWNTYRREAGRLLAEGQGGRHVLIKGEEILGSWATHDEAMNAGYQRFLNQPFLVHQVEERERVLRCVTVQGCRNLHLRFRLAS